MFPRTAASHDAIDIFWRSAGFLRPSAEFVERYARGVCGDTLRDDQLRHLHVSARICRRKYLSVTVAMAAIPLGFVLLVLGVLLE